MATNFEIKAATAILRLADAVYRTQDIVMTVLEHMPEQERRRVFGGENATTAIAEARQSVGELNAALIALVAELENG